MFKASLAGFIQSFVTNSQKHCKLVAAEMDKGACAGGSLAHEAEVTLSEVITPLVEKVYFS